MNKLSSLRGQLLLLLLIPLGTVWVFGSIAGYYLIKNLANSAYDRALLDSTTSLTALVKRQGDKVIVDLPQVALQIFRFDEVDRIFFQIRNQQGDVLAGDREMPPPPGGLAKLGEVSYYDSVIASHPVRVAVKVIPVINDRNMLVTVQVAETLNKRNLMAGEILIGSAVTQFILIALAAWIVWYGTARGLIPLLHIQQQLATRSHRDFRPLDVGEAPLEIQPLLRSMNDLLSRLGHASQVQQRFTSDAAHQLRTPLAGLKMQVEHALRQSDMASIRHALEQMRVSAERVIRVANQLLVLSRAEPESSVRVELKTIDLAQLARQQTMEWVPFALEKNIDLGYEGAEKPVLLQGEPFLLGELLANLIDNAIRYTPVGGKVTVRLDEGPPPVISVEDNGPGVPDEDRERVFERFYSVLGTRGAGGAGLGLAIVQEIAHLHHAQVSFLTAESGSGACVRVKFR